MENLISLQPTTVTKTTTTGKIQQQIATTKKQNNTNTNGCFIFGFCPHYVFNLLVGVVRVVFLCCVLLCWCGGIASIAATVESVTATASSRVDVFSTLFASAASITILGSIVSIELHGNQTFTRNNISDSQTQTYTVLYQPQIHNNFVGIGQTVSIRVISQSGLNTEAGGGQLTTSYDTQVQVAADLSYVYTPVTHAGKLLKTRKTQLYFISS